jgi:hypothetical protein
MPKSSSKLCDLQDFSPAERRVMIAKDVLAELRTKHIRPRQGVFVAAKYEDGTPTLVATCAGQPMHEALLNNVCECCALGAIFVAAVERFNDVESTDNHVSPNLGLEDIHAPIRKHFSETQMKLIENAFETGNGYFVKTTIDGRDRAVKFGMQFHTPRSRMTAIMKNIIENNGTFKP